MRTLRIVYLCHFVLIWLATLDDCLVGKGLVG